MDSIHTHLLSIYLWLTNPTPPDLHHRRRVDGERGEALTWVAVVGGSLLLAGLIYAALRAKADDLTKHVCQDVTTCK